MGETGNQWVHPVDKGDPVVLVEVEDVVLLWEDGVNWENPLLDELSISGGKPKLSGDGINELSPGLLPDDSLWGKLNISVDFIKTTLSLKVVEIQMSVDPLQEGLGVDLVMSNNLVAGKGYSKSVRVPVLNSVVGGGEGGGLLILEEGDQWEDILVEEDGIDEVLLEGGRLPEPLEVDGGNVPLEHGVLPILTKDGEGVVHSEKGVGYNFLQFVDGQVKNVITEVLGDLKVISVDEAPLQRMSQQSSPQQDVVSDEGTLVFEQGVGLPVQLQKVPGRLASHGGD